MSGNDFTRSAAAVVILTVLLGVAYPVVITAASQLIFSHQANGSLIANAHGRIIGSQLIGQEFTQPVGSLNGNIKKDRQGNAVVEPASGYFQSRPSQTAYDPSASAFSNAGPNSRQLERDLQSRADAYLRRTGSRFGQRSIPPDAVFTSGSGLDPHISPQNARAQAAAIAHQRKLPLTRVIELINATTSQRTFGFLGEPTVNVFDLNRALDQESQ